MGPSGANGDRAGAARPDPDAPSTRCSTSHLERFREVFEDAAIGMATMTLAGRLVRANRSLAGLFDMTVQDFVGMPLVTSPATTPWSRRPWSG